MANKDAPFGLKPIRHAHGAPYTGTGRPCYINASYGTALFIGDPVVKVAGGSNTSSITVPGIGEMPAGTMPSIEAASAGGPVFGVIQAFAAQPSDLETNYSKASTQGVAFVADDPDLIYEIQEVSGGTALAATDVGLNASFVAGSGSTATGLSGYELNNGTEASTSGLELKIISLSNKTDNAIGEHAVWEVKINDHTQAHGTAGI